jgi:hypothetical protein
MPSLSSSSTLPDDLTSFISQPPEPVEETIPNEELFIEEEVKEEPEKQMVVFGPPRVGNSSITATEQTIPNKNIIDNSIPSFLRPMNAPLPSVNIKDIIGQRPTASETKDIRQARIDKLDKKPLLAIEDEPIDIPTFTADELKSYKEKTKETRKAETVEEENEIPTSTSVEGYDDFVKYITDKNNKELTKAKLAEILIRNGITDPKTGNKFYIRTPDGTKKKIAMIHGNSNPVTKTALTELLRDKYKPGFVYKYLN